MSKEFTADALNQLMVEREARKAMMQTSNWVAAQEDGAREFMPISSAPLEDDYQRSKSATRSEFLGRLQTQNRARMASRDNFSPAAPFCASKNGTALPFAAGGESIVFGSDNLDRSTSNTAYGETSVVPVEPIDLLQTVPKLRDTTLDGAHRASMTEGHFLSIWEPFESLQKKRAASFGSAVQLREAHHRHIRSQFNPDEKYELPPTVQNDIGWEMGMDKYNLACAKFQEGATWHGRAGSHITKFSERLLLGARHHQSGPMTKPALHY
uniref:Uncharacterized protein n=1 Tax=Haptolina brevifila TaxID=156173 RepID=A0A7S2IYF6_9EUKA|mmetsp:Transcript_73198/g.145612  ORF Transcript_73198/g.145612 Transcript_73198/m.145612 type:complete len:268 (+) Transcript_73198:114-917(+)